MTAAVRFSKSLRLTDEEGSTVDVQTEEQERCIFMLDQLSSLDRRLQSLVDGLDNVYLEIEQAKELKQYRTYSEKAAEEFRDYILYQAKHERQQIVEEKVSALRKKVEKLRRQVTSRQMDNYPELSVHVQQLEQEYLFESKLNIGLQKHYNRSLQQDDLIRLKIQELQKREIHLLNLAERSAERVRETANQKALFKKYEALLAKRTALSTSNQESTQAYKVRVKCELDKLVKVEQQIIESNYFFAEMETAVAEQRLVIDQLKKEEGLSPDKQEKTPEEKYHVQFHTQKLQNELYEKYLGNRRHSSIVELPRYPKKQLQRRLSKEQSKKAQFKSIDKTPVRPQIQYQFVRPEGSLKLPEPFQYKEASIGNKQNLKRAINNSGTELPNIKKKMIHSTMKIPNKGELVDGDGSSTEISPKKQSPTTPYNKKHSKLQTEPSRKQPELNQESDESSSSNENIFRPVRITKEVVMHKPDSQIIIEDEASEESDRERLFTKPLQPKIIKKKNDRPTIPKQIEEESEEEDNQSTTRNQPPPVVRQQATPIQNHRPHISLVVEKQLYLSTSHNQDSQSEDEPVKDLPPPRVVNSPREPAKEKKLDSTSTEMATSNAPTFKKPYRSKGSNQRKGVPFEVEGHSNSPSDGEFNLSRVSSMYNPPSLASSNLNRIPHYTAEQLGLEDEPPNKL